MCHVSVIEFFVENTTIEEFRGNRVLEVGSKYVNGSVRPFVERFLSPKEYVGVDIERGKFVDVVCPAELIVDCFGEGSFDVVISTEVLEHVRDWRLVVDNMKRVLKPGGHIYITTRSRGFPYHGYPHDYWRYEIEDMKEIFADFDIIVLTLDHEALGVFLKAKKPADYRPKDLSSIALYSMVLGKRTTSIPDADDMPFSRKIKAMMVELYPRIIERLKSLAT